MPARAPAAKGQHVVTSMRNAPDWVGEQPEDLGSPIAVRQHTTFRPPRGARGVDQ